MLTATQFSTESAPKVRILLTFDQREKSRLLATSQCGAEIGVSLKPGTILKHGDVLALSDGRAARIEASAENVMEVRTDKAGKLTAIAYHVGNRHVPIEVGDGFIRLLPDHVLRAMIEGLGGEVTLCAAAFHPESGAYGHSHVHHSHDDQGHGGRIHAGLAPRAPAEKDPR